MKQKSIAVKPFVTGQFELPVIRITHPAGPSFKIVRAIVRGEKPVRVIAHQFNFALGV